MPELPPAPSDRTSPSQPGPPSEPPPAEGSPAVSGFSDPPGAPWAMQLVLRLEKSSPPSRRALLEASALAVASLLSDPRTAPGGVWSAAVDRWLEGRIRKLARRARGTRWAAVQELEGVSVSHRGAEVRAFPPAPTDELAPLLSKLQLSGPEPEVADTVTDLPAARPDPATPLLVICLSTRPPLGLGKAAAAAGHVSQIALMNADPGLSSAWRDAGFPLVVVEPDPQVFVSLGSSSPVVVRDAGFTGVPSGTITAVGYWL